MVDMSPTCVQGQGSAAVQAGLSLDDVQPPGQARPPCASVTVAILYIFATRPQQAQERLALLIHPCPAHAPRGCPSRAGDCAPPVLAHAFGAVSDLSEASQE